MKYLNVLIVLLLMMGGGSVYAQHKKTPPKKSSSKSAGKKQTEKPAQANSLDDKFTPDKNSIYNAKNSAGDNGSGSEDCSNIVKFNPTLLIRKTAAVFYERRLGEVVGLQGGLGLCYGVDPVQALLSGEGEMVLNFGDRSAVSYSTLLSQGKSSGIGLFLSLSSRFHYSSWYFNSNNSYIELNYRFNSNPLNLNAYANSNPSNFTIMGTDRDVSLRSNWYNVIWGTQFATEGKIQTTHEFYYGLGIRRTTFNMFATEQIQSNNSYYNTYRYYQTGERGKVLGFTFVAGYVFGIGFN